MNYQKIYNQICQRAKDQNRIKGGATYYEAHHIIPRCIGGEGNVKQWRNHYNIVLLTPKEHFICHRLLCELYPNEKKLVYALWCMCNQKNKSQSERHIPSSRVYNRIKLIAIDIIKQNNSGSKGFKHSKETIEIIKQKNKNKIVSQETKDKMRKPKRDTTKMGKYDKSGKNNPMFGKIRITNGVENKTINKEEVIPIGFKKGIIKIN